MQIHVLFFFMLMSINSIAMGDGFDEIVLRIHEKGKKNLLEHVVVTVKKEKFESDKNGIVRLKIAKEGDGYLRLVLGAYEPLEIPYSELRPSGEFDVYMIPSVEGENVVVVTGKKKVAQVYRKTVTLEEAEKIAPSGDPVQVIKLLPGVQTSGFAGDIIIRGSGPEDSKYYIDNLEVPFIFHKIGDLSVLPGSLIKDVKFESGGFGPEYGNATGGVVVIRSKTEIPKNPKTEFVFNVPFYSGVFHTRPIGETAGLAVGFRRSYIDVIIRKILEERNKKNDDKTGSLTIVPYFTDGQIVYWENDDRGYTKISLIAAYDGIKAAFPFDSFSDSNGRAGFEFYTGFVNLGLEKMQLLDKGWQMNSTPQLYFFNTNANIFGQTIVTRTWLTRIPTFFNVRLSEIQTLELGLDPSFQINNFQYDAIQFQDRDPTFDPEDAPVIKATTNQKYSLFASWINFDQKISNWTLSPGLRVFYNEQIHKSDVDPRFRLQYQFDEKITFKSVIGQYSQSPDSLAASPKVGNPNLDFQHSYHYVVGVENRWSEDWTSEFQLYYKTALKVVGTDPVDRFNNKGSFKSRGFEFFLRRNLISRLFGWFSYTYSKNVERDSPDQSYRNSTYDQTHVLYLVANYKITNTWQLGGRYNYHTGDTTTPINRAVYNSSLDKYAPRASPEENSSVHLPAFNALTIYAGHDWLFDNWKLNLRFGLESFWPKPQIVGISYNYDYSKSNNETGLSSIPFLELRGEF